MCLLVPCCSGCQQPGEGRRGQRWLLLSQGSSCSLDQSCSRGSQAVPSPTPTMQGKDARPSLLSSQGGRRREKCKNHPTALPARCTHAANAPVLFYPGLPMAPCVNTASAHTRVSAGSSACKAHIWEARLTSMHLFSRKWVLLKLEG